MKESFELARNRLAVADRIVIYGAGLAMLGVLEKIRHRVAYIVTDDPSLAGRKLPGGLEVCAPDRISREKVGEVFVLIAAWTQGAISVISRKLAAMGLKNGENFTDISIAHHESISARIEETFGWTPDLQRFLECRQWFLNIHPPSVSAIAGTWLYAELMERMLGGVPGDVAECGVYQGGNAFLALMMSPSLRNRTYGLFDTFEGFPEVSSADPATRRDHFRDVDYAGVRSRFDSFPRVAFHRGLFSETFPRLPERQYSLVYIDCDLYRSSLDCLEYFWPRMADGGVLFIHDLWVPDRELAGTLKIDCYEGVKQAVSEYFPPEEAKKLVIFPETTHGIYRKDKTSKIAT